MGQEYRYLAIGILLITALMLLLLLAIHARNKKNQRIHDKIQRMSGLEKKLLLERIAEPYGFGYDVSADLFYSLEDAWQKRFGYHRIYDELAGAMGMIIDSEPIPFFHEGKEWLIEFWKGQYGICTGAEAGIYTKEEENGWYQGVTEEHYIGIGMTLYEKERIVLQRRGFHWWMTGFALGRFASPKHLHVKITLVFPSAQMRRNFIEGLRKAGYKEDEYLINREVVHIRFGQPHTKQPVNRKAFLTKMRLWKLKWLCRLFCHYTKEYDNTLDKMTYLYYKAPKLFRWMNRIGNKRKDTLGNAG